MIQFFKMKKLNYLYYLFLFFILIGFGYLVSFNSLDPDFGWHLKTGELILERGVPKTDWYSFTMPNFSWIDHEWLADVLIYKIYSIFGFQILLLLFLAIASASFVILIKPENFWFYLLPILLGFFAIFGFLGIRPQIITVLFIAILWRILIDFLEDKKLGRQLIYFLPILFVVWANLHGGFFSGLFILFLILALEAFKKTIFFEKLIKWPFFNQLNYKKQPIKKIFLLFIIIFFSFLTTLVNPYGPRIYEEIFRTISDNFLRFHIAEWLPLFFGNPSVFTICYLSLFLGFLIPLRKKIEFNKLILATVFLIFSLLSQRHFFIFTILTVPIFVELLLLFRKEVKPENVKILFSGAGKWIILLLAFSLLFSGFYQVTRGLLKENYHSFYPQKALPFLKTLPLSENLFNEYGWGGYLIWKMPERKLFIDGRMPSWRKGGQFVFGDYVKIIKAEQDFQELLDKYDIKIMLLKNDKTEEPRVENRLPDFLKRQKWLLKTLGLSPSKNLYQELVNSGWQIIYQDGTAVILRR